MATEAIQVKPQAKREVKLVATKRVCCDGGEGALGHPRVYLDMGEGTEVVCPYCDRLFVFDETAS